MEPKERRESGEDAREFDRRRKTMSAAFIN